MLVGLKTSTMVGYWAYCMIRFTEFHIYKSAYLNDIGYDM